MTRHVYNISALLDTIGRPSNDSVPKVSKISRFLKNAEISLREISYRENNNSSQIYYFHLYAYYNPHLLILNVKKLIFNFNTSIYEKMVKHPNQNIERLSFTFCNKASYRLSLFWWFAKFRLSRNVLNIERSSQQQ